MINMDWIKNCKLKRPCILHQGFLKSTHLSALDSWDLYFTALAYTRIMLMSPRSKKSLVQTLAFSQGISTKQIWQEYSTNMLKQDPNDSLLLYPTLRFGETQHLWVKFLFGHCKCL